MDDGPERLPLPPVLKNVQIEDVINQNYITQLESIGFPIYRGTTPPDITGCYLFDAQLLVASNLNTDSYWLDLWDPGWAITRFFDYTVTDRRISSEEKGKSKPGSLMPASQSTSKSFGNISGTGNNFTYFAITTVEFVVTDVTNQYYGRKVFGKTANISSGIKTATGIQNPFNAMIVLEKSGDNENLFTVPIGTIRVFQEMDGIAANWNWNNHPWGTSSVAPSDNNLMISIIGEGNTTTIDKILYNKLIGGK